MKTTKRTYSLLCEEDNFKNSEEERQTKRKRIETLVESINNEGWACKLYRNSLSELCGTIYKRFRDTELWSYIGEISDNQVEIIGENPKINEFLNKYDIKQIREMTLEERKRLYYENEL